MCSSDLADGKPATRRAPKKEGDAEIVTGRNSVVEALRAKIPATTLYLAARLEMDDRVKEAISIAGKRGIPIVEVMRPEERPLAEQLRCYATADRLLFAEGSALHGLQLLGRGLGDVAVLVRRSGSTMLAAATRARARSVAHLDVAVGLIHALEPSGRPAMNGGVAVLDERLLVRARDGEAVDVPAGEVDYMDVSARQMVSAATAMIPFLEHDDANRALMGANMQRQAVPLLRSESPVVGTGMEGFAAIDAGDVLTAEKSGRSEEHTSELQSH